MTRRPHAQHGWSSLQGKEKGTAFNGAFVNHKMPASSIYHDSPLRALRRRVETTALSTIERILLDRRLRFRDLRIFARHWRVLRQAVRHRRETRTRWMLAILGQGIVKLAGGRPDLRSLYALAEWLEITAVD